MLGTGGHGVPKLGRPPDESNLEVLEAAPQPPSSCASPRTRQDCRSGARLVVISIASGSWVIQVNVTCSRR